jgi:putative ATPase
MQKIEQEGAGSVPKHLQDGNRDGAPTGQGQGYDYPHEHEGHFIPQQYLPKKLLGTYFYQPSAEGYETQVTSRLAAWREAQRKALSIEKTVELPDLPEERIRELKRNIK